MLLNELEQEQELATKKYRFKSRTLFFLLPILLVVSIFGFYHVYKPLPIGLDFASEDYVVNEADVKFLFDPSTQSTSTSSPQLIFDHIFKYIDESEQYILLDMFLFNDWSKQAVSSRKLTKELTDHLLAKKLASPDIKIDFITDPINTIYGGTNNTYLQKLSEAGINVIITDLRPLADPNPLYSAWWRTFVVWFANSSRYGYLANPFSYTDSPVTLRSYLDLFNFKANHRKVFVADNQGQLVTIIGSGNPHDASAANSNAAIFVRGPLAEAVYQSEAAVAKLSSHSLYSLPQNLLNKNSAEANKYATASLVSEGQIKQAILKNIAKLITGDEIRLAMFYLSDQDIIKSLLAAAKQGVEIKLILDANQQAFGYEKIGVPNLPIAQQLHDKSQGKIQIKWAKSAGEQFHTKLLATTSKLDKRTTIISGSANFTRRNLDNYNLESDLVLTLNTDWDLAAEFDNYFSGLWSNADNYEIHSYVPWWLTTLTWLEERTGLGTF